MCGISTIVTLAATPISVPNEIDGTHTYERALEKELDASLNRITHRGPDSRGTWISKQGQVGKK
jgi:asparagine synthetase B (glutamine-hydrolysing)